MSPPASSSSSASGASSIPVVRPNSGLEGEAGRLGFGVIGDAVWDPQARVRLRLGPLTREQFESFIPGGSAHEALRALARLYADDIVGVDAQLVLTRREVTPCVLDIPGSTPGARRGPGLGRGTWLASRPALPRSGRDHLATLLIRL